MNIALTFLSSRTSHGISLIYHEPSDSLWDPMSQRCLLCDRFFLSYFWLLELIVKDKESSKNSTNSLDKQKIVSCRGRDRLHLQMIGERERNQLPLQSTWSKPNHLHSSQGIIVATLSSLLLYSFFSQSGFPLCFFLFFHRSCISFFFGVFSVFALTLFVQMR